MEHPMQRLVRPGASLGLFLSAAMVTANAIAGPVVDNATKAEQVMASDPIAALAAMD
jgi:hypothetical protein